MAKPGSGSRWKVSSDDLKEVFRFLSSVDEVEEFCGYLELEEWSAGSILLKEGEPADHMGFLVSGKLTIKKETSFPGKHILVAILDKGAMVGELSVLNRAARTATVEATEESQLLMLSSDNLERLLEENSSLGVKLLKRMFHVVRLRVRQADDRLARLL